MEENKKQLTSKTMENKFDWTRVNNDVNGNPRYVCHFLEIADSYIEALNIAANFGGRKFNNRQYGGGIVFQTYSIKSIEDRLIEASPKHRRIRYAEAVRKVNEMGFGWSIEEFQDMWVIDGNFGEAIDQLFDLAIHNDEGIYQDAIKALCSGDKEYANTIKLSVGAYRYNKIMAPND